MTTTAIPPLRRPSQAISRTRAPVASPITLERENVDHEGDRRERYGGSASRWLVPASLGVVTQAGGQQQSRGDDHDEHQKAAEDVGVPEQRVGAEGVPRA